MKSGKCPKCGGTKIISNQNKLLKGEHSIIHQGLFKPIRSTTYVCFRCGFVEDYIDTKDLDRLARKWV